MNQINVAGGVLYIWRELQAHSQLIAHPVERLHLSHRADIRGAHAKK